VRKTGAAVPEGQEFTIAGSAPSRAQKRLALGVFIVLLTGLTLPMTEFGSVQSPNSTRSSRFTPPRWP
jgi:hypothetical protein